MESDFLTEVSQYLSRNGLQVIRFEFPYMQQRRRDGKKRPPDRAEKLLLAFRGVIAQFKDHKPLFLAGKSMGGRMATMLLSSSDARGCFVFGYPFHPQGKALTTRIDHFQDITQPVHIFQGERDSLGNKVDVTEYRLPPVIQIYWLADGNHDLKPRRKSGYTQQQHISSALSKMLSVIKQYT